MMKENMEDHFKNKRLNGELKKSFVLRMTVQSMFHASTSSKYLQHLTACRLSCTIEGS